jgi:hypothetical protein
MKYKKMSPFRAWNCIALFLSLSTCFAQQKLPLIKAGSTAVTIKDGYIIREGIWNLSPDVKPDVYQAIASSGQKTVTFYTDIDSISFQVSPGNTYSFNILLHNKDTCLTQISTAGSPLKAVGSPLKAAANAPLPLNPELLAMDFVVFRNALLTEHGGLYRYQPERTLNHLMDSCLLSINKPMTTLEFGKKILFITSKIRDGHTGTNISGLLVNNYLENTKLFPLTLYFTGNRAFVRCSKLEAFPTGTEILSINGEKINLITGQLSNYLSSDGNITTKKYQTLNNGAFPVLYKWIYDHGDSLSISYKNLQGKILTTRIAAQLASDFECEQQQAGSGTKDLDLSYPQPNTALLTIKTFDVQRLARNQFNFAAFLKQVFAELRDRKTGNLIIDLRGNAGGQDSYGPLLYSYLTDKAFTYFAAIQTADRKVTVAENSFMKPQQSQANPFKGKLLILINVLSFSASADFCALIKSADRAKFIGEETGGGYYGNTSGQTTKLELPNTKIKVMIPKYSYFNAVKKTSYPDRGIIPDYPVVPDVFQLTQNKDVQLELALGLIGGK